MLSDKFDVTIITARLRRDLPARDHLQGKVPVIRVGFGLPIDKYLFPILAPFAASRFRPDIVHAVLESYAGLAMIVCKWIVPSAKRILTCQSTNTSMFVKAMHKVANVVTVISSVLKERAARFGRADAVLIPNGIHFAQIRQACATTSKIPGRVLFVGRLEQMKGVDTLLQSIALMTEKPQVHIVGDGSQRSTLQSFTASLGLTRSVTFLGRLDGQALLKEYAEAEIFCGLSRSEALGNVFLEAQAAECAVVATNVGGIPDIVKDGEAGILVPADDPQHTAQILTKLLTDRDWRRTLASAGPKNAENYDWTVIAKKYKEVYDAFHE